MTRVLLIAGVVLLLAACEPYLKQTRSPAPAAPVVKTGPASVMLNDLQTKSACTDFVLVVDSFNDHVAERIDGLEHGPAFTVEPGKATVWYRCLRVVGNEGECYTAGSQSNNLGEPVLEPGTRYLMSCSAQGQGVIVAVP